MEPMVTDITNGDQMFTQWKARNPVLPTLKRLQKLIKNPKNGKR
jgi:hypothetical protein